MYTILIILATIYAVIAILSIIENLQGYVEGKLFSDILTSIFWPIYLFIIFPIKKLYKYLRISDLLYWYSMYRRKFNIPEFNEHVLRIRYDSIWSSKKWIDKIIVNAYRKIAENRNIDLDYSENYYKDDEL